MAQPARKSRKTPLSIEPFWERPTSGPPNRWEKRRIQVKLAILARENITLDTLLQPKPTTVRLLLSQNLNWPPKMGQKMGPKNQEQLTEASMGIKVPKNNGGRRFV